MHFLTPHVEISMADNNDNNGPLRLTTNNNNNHHSHNHKSNGTSSNDHHSKIQPTSVTATTSSGLDIQAIVRPLNNNNNNGSPPSPQSADSNSNVPSSSHSSIMTNEVQSSRHLLFENAIKPSISLIPIKQVNIFLSFFLCRCIYLTFTKYTSCPRTKKKTNKYIKYS